MAIGISAASTATTYPVGRIACFRPRNESPTSTSNYLFHPLDRDLHIHIYPLRRKKNFAICVLTNNRMEHGVELEKRIDAENLDHEPDNKVATSRRLEERLAKKKSERETYLIAAILSSVGITSMAILAVYYRFSWQMEVISCFPYLMFTELIQLFGSSMRLLI